jgi:hypothetical protein
MKVWEDSQSGTRGIIILINSKTLNDREGEFPIKQRIS